MLQTLRQRQAQQDPIRVGLVGAGSMGLAIAHQIALTPGMELVFVGDLDPSAAKRGAQAGATEGSSPSAVEDVLGALASEALAVDVFVEATNAIHEANDYCVAALQNGAHVVLMNAEVDLAYGYPLRALAREKGLVVTSDAGDQHGVLLRMIEEIQLWGFRLVQAGNMKGFLKRDATVASLEGEAAKRRLSAVQCCAYTDGTKLNIEMAIVANATGMIPTQPGMVGPKCGQVEEVLGCFDFDTAPAEGAVDYVLGAVPGGGVYVVGHCDHPLQQFYLDYYKLGEGPYYVFYRPYHLCHLETTRAIARAALWGKSMFDLLPEPVAEVYAYAKRDLVPGDVFEHGLGDDLCYGQVDSIKNGTKGGHAPSVLLAPKFGSKTAMVKARGKDEPILLSDLSPQPG